MDTTHGPGHPEPQVLDPSAIQQLKDLDESGDNTLIRELCDAFLNDAEQRMDLIRQSLKTMDLKSLSATAHALKGGAANFGAKRFTTLCQSLQQAGTQPTPDQATALVATLEKEFILLKTALQELKS